MEFKLPTTERSSLNPTKKYKYRMKAIKPIIMKKKDFLVDNFLNTDS